MLLELDIENQWYVSAVIVYQMWLPALSLAQFEDVNLAKSSSALIAKIGIWYIRSLNIHPCSLSKLCFLCIIARCSCGLSCMLPVWTDVLALACALNELGYHTRRGRTALWCSLQLSSRDLPLICLQTAVAAASKWQHCRQRYVHAALSERSIWCWLYSWKCFQVLPWGSSVVCSVVALSQQPSKTCTVSHWHKWFTLRYICRGNGGWFNYFPVPAVVCYSALNASLLLVCKVH